jgi:hypothetical protein
MKKFKRFVMWIVILAIVGFIGYVYVTGSSTITVNNKTATSTPVVVEDKNDEVDSIMKRKEFQEKMRIQAEYTLLTEQKAEEEKRHDAEMERIEKRLEELRGKELSFQ